LALFYVRNELEKNLPSSSSSIKQFTINDPYFETLLKIKDDPADALFFSVYIWNASYLYRLLNDLNGVIPNKVIVLGGPQAPSLREKLTFKPAVVHGQIEDIDLTFYRDLNNKLLQSDYLSCSNNTFTYPYKQEDFEGQLKNRNIYYESSRGCPFFCAYCLSSTSHGVLSKDINQVKKELFDIIKESPKNIRFVDRTFNANPERALEIWRFLRDHADGICSYHFEIAPDLFTEEMFSFLEEIPESFFQFEIGVQSTNQKTLLAVNRKMDITKSFKNIKRLIKLGTLDIHIDLILGLPEETKESFAQSIRDVLFLQPNNLQMGLLKVLPDTNIFKIKNLMEIISCIEPPYQVMSTKWMDSQTISELYWIGECIEAFYNKKFFKTFFSYIIEIEDDIFLFFSNLVKHCNKNYFFNMAKTHELMNSILVSFIITHDRIKILREFLILDWLLCGHRFLPNDFNEILEIYQKTLFDKSALEIEGIYTIKERCFFYKKGVFFKFSANVLSHCNISDSNDDLYLGFFTEYKKKTIAVPLPLFLE
jgi:hypothetical protein